MVIPVSFFNGRVGSLSEEIKKLKNAEKESV